MKEDFKKDENNFIKNFDRGKIYFYNLVVIDPDNFDPIFNNSSTYRDNNFKFYCLDDDPENIYIESGEKYSRFPNNELKNILNKIRKTYKKIGFSRIIYESLVDI